MKKTTFIVSILAAFLTVGCSEHRETAAPITQVLAADSTDPGTIYGLACDGCNDTLLIVLTSLEQDPDTFDVLDATRQQRVYGYPRIGDKVAVIPDTTGSKTADMVVVLTDLQATWCYEVLPSLRKRVSIEQAIASTGQSPTIADSIKRLLATPCEYSYRVKGDNTVTPRSGQPMTLAGDEESPIEYPAMKHYREWRLNRGKVLLTEMTYDSLGNRTPGACDTAEIVLLQRDTLVLRINDTVQGFYRKQETSETAE